MNAKTLGKVAQVANRLAADGFVFHAQLLRDGIDNSLTASAVERVAILLEKAKRPDIAKRLRDVAAAPK